MNRIILAYSHHNADLARHIDRQLSRIGIPFEHASERLPGELASQISGSGEPALVLITDNFLKDRACMTGMLAAVQSLTPDQPLLFVVADGINEQGQSTPTHIDRMVNALQYMNFWQNAWLDISTQYQQAEGIEKQVYEAELDAVRTIANQVGDFISLVRDRSYVTREQLESDDYVIFFVRFGLSDWHGQYRRLVAQTSGDQQIVEAPHLPEMPLSSGVLAPEPMEEPELPPPVPTPEEVPEIKEVPEIPQTPEIPEIPEQEPEVEIPTHFPEQEEVPADHTVEIEQAMRDAHFWLEKGYIDRGLELLQLASEQYPDEERLAGEYQSALARYRPAETPEPEQETHTENGTPGIGAEGSNEAKSYDLMGDMAAGKGDFLFAKYCWDRVVELDPAFPDIYRKLGLMTSEHLQDYRETAVHYLNKALEIKPLDGEVLLAMAQHSLQNNAREEARAWYERAIVVDEHLRNDDNDRQFAPQQEFAAQAEVEAPQEHQPVEALPEPPEMEEVVETVPEVPVPEKSAGPLVLITGATSGIGKATAELFAQNGYRLILTGRRVDRLVALKNSLEESFGTDVLLLPFDVRDAGAVEAALTNLPDNFQQIDILINNAGLAKGFSPIHEGSLSHWDTMIDTNVKGLVYVSRIVSQGMVQRKSGQIINVGSIAGKEIYPNGNVYCASKAAVDALTRAMRYDLFTHNIRVGQVSPGHVEETEFAITRFDGDAERAKIYNDFQPLTAHDVADAIYYMVTRPPHVNIQDVYMFSTQQASATAVNRNGRV
ncbi:MAG TPA: SDR family NAD(P)-dependent oxidoreductase [Saprospiraceae bacterium]|nr:SDR family NAD(P)-dependent oxidoreductase [Saprospiraceae bacterium]HPI06839.1 SDR family NAD(P)-dependent oxidoreductase [Saprospiraceae bacterium]